MAEAKSFLLFFKPRTLMVSVVYSFVLYIILRLAEREGVEAADSFYGSILSLLSISTGFVASFYFFVVSRGTDFLRQIEKTKTFKSVLLLTSITLKVSLFVIFLVFLLTIFAPIGFGVPRLNFLFELFWIFLLSLVAANFVRCIKLFLLLAK